MASNRVLHSVLLAAGVLLIGACASQPAPGSLDDKYFQTEAKNYDKYQHEGQTVYCTKVKNHVYNGLVPYTGEVKCISEANLRRDVRDWRRARNAVAPPLM